MTSYDLGPHTIELIQDFATQHTTGAREREAMLEELREIAVAAHCHATRLAFTEVETAIKKWQR